MDNIDLEQLQGIVNDIIALEAEHASEEAIDERCAELADFVDKLSGTNYASSSEDGIVTIIIDTGDDNTLEIQVPNFSIGDDTV
jgi:hypothetical protein